MVLFQPNFHTNASIASPTTSGVFWGKLSDPPFGVRRNFFGFRLNYAKFGQLIPSKIGLIVATIYTFIRNECNTKNRRK